MGIGYSYLVLGTRSPPFDCDENHADDPQFMHPFSPRSCCKKYRVSHLFLFTLSHIQCGDLCRNRARRDVRLWPLIFGKTQKCGTVMELTPFFGFMGLNASAAVVHH